MDPTNALTTGAIAVLAEKLGAAELLKRVAGPSLDLIGERAKQRLERVFEKAAPMIEQAGTTPHIIPDRILVPLLEGASREDDETLQNMWARLLATAASEESTVRANPAFVSILKEMSSDEALLLQAISSLKDSSYIEIYQLVNLEHTLGWGLENRTNRIVFSARFSNAVDGLESTMLLRRIPISLETLSYNDGAPLPFHYELTGRGVSFVEACVSPQLPK